VTSTKEAGTAVSVGVGKGVVVGEGVRVEVGVGTGVEVGPGGFPAHALSAIPTTAVSKLNASSFFTYHLLKRRTASGWVSTCRQHLEIGKTTIIAPIGDYTGRWGMEN
jgi:hypothetical protein